MVIIVEGGVIQSIYSDNANAKAIVIDLDDKKTGGDFIHTFGWPDTQFDDDEIKDLMGEQYENYFDEKI